MGPEGIEPPHFGLQPDALPSELQPRITYRGKALSWFASNLPPPVSLHIWGYSFRVSTANPAAIIAQDATNTPARNFIP